MVFGQLTKYVIRKLSFHKFRNRRNCIELKMEKILLQKPKDVKSLLMSKTSERFVHVMFLERAISNSEITPRHYFIATDSVRVAYMAALCDELLKLRNYDPLQFLKHDINMRCCVTFFFISNGYLKEWPSKNHVKLNW